MKRLLLSLALVSSLAACGFHLRDSLQLPPGTPALQVHSSTPYSKLVGLLERNLRAAGATVAAGGTADGETARLALLSERWGDLPLAIDAFGRAQEYRMRYAVIFVLQRPDGSDVVPQQVVELSRDYVAPPTDATGTSTEREILADELRRDMAAAILRRIDSVLRSRPEGIAPAAPAAAQVP